MPQKLLIVDDESEFAFSLRDVGERLGFEVEVTTSAKEFKKVYKGFDPSCIVVDIVMPDTDGIELLQWLAEKGMPTKTILVSGYNPAYAQWAKDIGIALGIASIVVLKKPVRMADLRAALDL